MGRFCEGTDMPPTTVATHLSVPVTPVPVVLSRARCTRNHRNHTKSPPHKHGGHQSPCAREREEGKQNSNTLGRTRASIAHRSLLVAGGGQRSFFSFCFVTIPPNPRHRQHRRRRASRTNTPRVRRPCDSVGALGCFDLCERLLLHYRVVW